MRRIARALIAPLLLLMAVEHAAGGRGDKSGTAGASELQIPVGARSVALGGSALATSIGVEAMYWNPAGLARGEDETEVMFSHMSYLAGIGVEFAGVSVRFGSLGQLGFSVKSLSIGEIPVTTEDQPDGNGQTASPTFLVAGGTFSRQVTEKISVGLTANVIYESMDQVSATGVSFSAGVQYSGLGGIDGLALGAAVKNVGPRLKYDGSGLERTAEVGDALRGNAPLKIEAAGSDLPSTIEIGLGYSMSAGGQNRLAFTSAFQNNNYSEDEYRFGGEYLYDGLLSLRAGIAVSPQDEGNEYIFGPTGGIGVRTKIEQIAVSIDYAFRTVKYFSSNHVITLHVGF